MADRPQKHRDSKVSQATGYGQATSKTIEKSAKGDPSRAEQREDGEVPTREKGKQRAYGEETRPPKNVAGSATTTQRITRSKSRTEAVPPVVEETTTTAEPDVETVDKDEYENELEPDTNELENIDETARNEDTVRERNTTRRPHTATGHHEDTRSRHNEDTRSRHNEDTRSLAREPDPELVEIVNSSIDYLHDSRRRMKRYQAQRAHEDEKMNEMVEMSAQILKGMSKVVRRLNLPVNDKELLLAAFDGEPEYEPEEQPVAGPSNTQHDLTTPPETAEHRATSDILENARYGKDRETRLREAGLAGDGSVPMHDNETGHGGQAMPSHDGEEGEATPAPTTGKANRHARVAAGAPDGGDSDGSDDDDGDGYKDNEHVPTRRVRRNERKQSVERNKSHPNRGNSASAARTYSASLPLVKKMGRSIRKVLESVLYTEPETLPSVSKHFKASAPDKYSGEDDVDRFYSWLQNLVRYYWMIRMVGVDNDESRVYAVGDALGGEALTWYNSEVQDPRRQQWDWTFEEVILELHRRFVREATVQLATERYEAATYRPSTGVSGLYTEMMKYATQMVEHPGDYAFRRKFLRELPEEMSNNIMRNSKMTAENNDMEEILEEALAIENAEKTARLFQKQRGGRTIVSKVIEAGNRAGNGARTSTSNRPLSGRFVRRFTPTDKKNTSSTTAEKSISMVTGGSASAPVKSTSEGKPNDKPTTSATGNRNLRQIDMSKIQCFKCKEFGHFASAHDKPGLRAMKVESDDDRQDKGGEVDDEHDDVPEELGEESFVDGEQYDGSDESIEELDEYTLAEEFYEGEEGYLTFAPMRLLPRGEREDSDDGHSIRVVSDEQSEEEDHVEEDNESENPRAAIVFLHDLRDAVNALRVELGQILRNENVAANGERMPLTEIVVGEDASVPSIWNRADGELMHRLRDGVRALAYDAHGLRTDLTHIWWAMDNGASEAELANIIYRARRRETSRAAGNQVQSDDRSTYSSMLANEAAQEYRETRVRHREPTLGGVVVARQATEFLRREIQELEGTTGDTGETDGEDLSDLPPLDEVDPREYEYDDGTITSLGEPEVQNQEGSSTRRLPWDGGVFEFRGMRLVKQEHLRSMTEDKGHRASMRVTSQAKPRPAMDTDCVTVDVSIGGLKGVALVDTGSSINAISPAFACVAGLEAFPLEKPIGLQLGCVGSRSKINFGMTQDVIIGAVTCSTYMDVVNLDHYDVILGIPFLKRHEIVLHLGDNTMKLGGETVKTRKDAPRKISNTQRERARRSSANRDD